MPGVKNGYISTLRKNFHGPIMYDSILQYKLKLFRLMYFF